jgi:hypothetical protein
LCVEENYRSTALDLLKKVFYEHQFVDYLIWLLPHNAPVSDVAWKHFSNTGIALSALSTHSVLLVKRETIIPPFFVREALIEDNDDIVPILKTQYGKSNIGEYFLADIIERKDDNIKTYVGVENDRANSFLSISLAVNTQLIEKMFDFSGFFLIKSSNTLKIAIMVDDSDIQAMLKLAQKTEFVVLQLCDFDGESIHILDEEKNDKFSAPEDIDIFCESYIDPMKSQSGVIMIITEALLKKLNAKATSNWKIHSFISLIEYDYKFVDKFGWNITSIPKFDDLERKYDEVFKVVTRSKDYHIENANYVQKSLPNGKMFGISLLCLHPQVEHLGDSLLKLAFEENPNVDYGLYLVPSTSKSPICKCMSRIPLLPGISFDQTLFMCHRKSLFVTHDFIRIERVTKMNLREVSTYMNTYVQDPTRKANFFQRVKETTVAGDDQSGHDEISYVCKLGSDVISVLSLSRSSTNIEEILWMRSRYDIDKLIDIDRHRNRSQAMITDWHIIPVLGNWGRFIVQEIMKSYKKTVLYFMSSHSCPPQVLNVMIPVNFRRQMEDIDGEGSTNDAPTDNKSLYVISKYHIQRQKKFVYSRVLLVGGSLATFSILETLCMNADIHPVNITVVIEDMPQCLLDQSKRKQKSTSLVANTLSVDEMVHYGEVELQLLGIQHKAKYIRGKVTDIDRKNKSVILSDESVIEYDILLLSPASQDSSIRKFPSTKGFLPASLMRRGVFCLGNSVVDSAALDWIDTAKSKENIIVYGCSLTAVNVIERLLSEGVDPSLIVVISDKSYVADFGHPSLQLKAEGLINESGVRVFLNCDIVDVHFGEHHFVESVKLALSQKLQNHGQDETICCGTLICCMETFIDTDLHAALNESDLVYDGGIVVDQVSLILASKDCCLNANECYV